MAFKTGIATNHTNFVETLLTFLTTELPLAERHIILRNTTAATSSGITREVWLQAPGMSGVNYFYHGFRLNVQTALDVFNLDIGVANGFVSGNTWETQPGLGSVGLNLWNQAIPYWMNVTGRSINIVVKIQNHYFSSCNQLPLLWNIPSTGQYFPFVGGSQQGGINNTRYSVPTLSNWYNNKAGGISYIKNIAGVWTQSYICPYSLTGNTSTGTRRNLPANLDSNLSVGIYGIHPLLVMTYNPNNLYGQLDGLAYVSGFNNAAENIITGSNGLTYIVFPDNARNGFGEYLAMRMS